MVTELLDHGADVYVNVNNHYEGSAPLTIDRIGRLLAKNAGKAYRQAPMAGATLIAIFVVIRYLDGLGNIRPCMGNEWIDVLNTSLPQSLSPALAPQPVYATFTPY